MRSDLSGLLRCPDCGGGLEPAPGETVPGPGDEIEEGELACSGCGRHWPVVRGIPRLLREGLPDEVRESGGRFGYEWTVYPELHSFYDDQFLAWIGPARREDFRGRSVLDAGCGKGRHLALAHQYGAARVVGVDVGMAVEAARANTRNLEGVDVIQGDLLRMPLRPGFDLIYSVGVLHHLPDPAEGLRSLARLLAPGGRIHAWVYGWEGNAWIRRGFDPLRKHILRRLPPALIRPLAFLASLPLWAVSRAYGLAARVAPGLHRSLFYRDYTTFLSTIPFRSLFWIVFDQMVAPTTHYIREEDLRGWLKEAGLDETGVEGLRGMSWRGWGRAPAGGEGGP